MTSGNLVKNPWYKYYIIKYCLKIQGLSRTEIYVFKYLLAQHGNGKCHGHKDVAEIPNEHRRPRPKISSK